MFSSNLKMLRHYKKLSQVELGKQLSVSKQSVSNWENDNILPSIEVLVRVAEFFQVSTDFLLGLNTSSKAGRTIDVSALTEEQIYHIQLVVDDLASKPAP